MQYFDINLAPGAVREINVQGSFVYFLNGSAGGADTTIELRAVSGADTVLLKPGQAFRLGASNNQRWAVANHAGQGTIIGQLLMGDGDFFDNRISGSVEVIDGGKSRTAAGVAGVSNVFSPAVAGRFSTAQLWNPSNSGKNVVVKAVGATVGTAGTFLVRVNTQALVTLAGNPVSKKNAEIINSFDGRSEALAAWPGTGVMAIGVPANQFVSYRFEEPVVIGPGFGLCITNADANIAITGTAEFYSEGV